MYRVNKTKALFSVAFFFIGFFGFSQGADFTGSIVGKLTDKEAGDEPLPFATVSIKGTTKGATTDFDGLFGITGLEPGTYTIQASFVGYEPVELAGLVVESGKSTEVSFGMGASEVKLAEVVITAKAQTESEMTLLLVQRKSIEMKQSIGAQELTRKGVSDAEGAVTKVTGVSKQEGSKNVVVRGLDDRYNSTSYNGLPLPSEDPEYKNISLSFFTTDIINSIDVNKTFSTSGYGNVGGADINILSKELFEDQELSISLSSGLNSSAARKNFTRIDGTNSLGLMNFNKQPISDLTQYDFQNSYDASEEGKPVNYSVGIKGGKRFFINGKALSTFLVASTGTDYIYREGVARSNPTSAGLVGRDLYGFNFIQSSNQTAMANIGYELNSSTNIRFNSLLIHSNSQNFGEFNGQAENISEVDGASAFIRRQQVNDNTLLVNQLHFDTELNNKLTLETSAGFNTVWGNEPDRRVNTFQRDDETDTYEVASGSGGANHRFFSRLKEDDFVGRAVLNYKLNLNPDSNDKITLGYNFRNTQRLFEYNQFAFATPGARATVDINNVDATFNQSSLDSETFLMQTNRGSANFDQALNPEYYEGSKFINAVFLNASYDLTEKLTIDGGIRAEMINQEVFWNFGQDQPNFPGDKSTTTTIQKTYFLPSFNARYAVNEDNIVRFAASKTYILPQFKEVSPFLYENIAFRSFGNKDLQPSDVYNIDLKFDHFFSRGELVSLGAFYKYVDLPINRLQVNSAGSDLSYVNTPSANVYGLEAELRKTVWNISSDSYINLGANVSYLFSEQSLDDVDFDEITARTFEETSPLQGASPLLLVGDVTYQMDTERLGITSAVIFSSFEDRINAIGTRTKSIKGLSYPTLDWVSKIETERNWEFSFSVKNILNPNVEEAIENVVLTRYQNGITYSLGVTYKLF